MLTFWNPSLLNKKWVKTQGVDSHDDLTADQPY